MSRYTGQGRTAAGFVTVPGGISDPQFFETLETLGAQIDKPVLPVGAPATSPAVGVEMFARSIAGRFYPAFEGSSGLDSALQPILARNGVTMWVANSGTSLNGFGTLPTNVGTVSTPTISGTAPAFANSLRRWRLASATTANSASESRSAQLLCLRGTEVGVGGFTYIHRFSEASTVATQRLFVGLTSSTGAIATTQDPAAMTNCIGVGHGPSDTTLRVYTNDASGACVQTDLGALFPSNTVAAVYELALFAAPSAAAVSWQVTRLDTGSIATGTITTDLPANTVGLTPHAYMNNGGTAAAVILDQSRMYLETDN